MNVYLEHNYEDLLETSKNICGHQEDYRDVCNEMVAELLELPIEKQTKLLNSKGVKWYFIRMVKLSSQSKTSKYQRKYNLLPIDRQKDIRNINQESSIDSIEYNDFYDRIDVIANKLLDWYEKRIFYIYIKEGKTFKQMSNETSIPTSSIFNTYKIAKNKIINELNREITRD